MRLSTMCRVLLVVALCPVGPVFESVTLGQPGASGSGGGSGSPSARPRQAVDLPGQLPTSQLVEYSRGLVRPSRQVTLRSPLNERLESVLVTESERVKAGDILARLDSRAQVLAVESARLEAESEARLRKAELAVDEATVTLEIVTDLDTEDVVGPWEIRRARLQKRQADADLQLAQERAEQAQLQYEQQKERLARYEIEAPFDGTVHRIEADPGTLLNSEQPMLSMVALDPLLAVVYVPFEQYGQLREGGRYAFEAGSPINRRLIGELTTIDPVLDPASRSFRCVFEIGNPDLTMPAGFMVRLLGPAENHQTGNGQTGSGEASDNQSASSR